MQDSRAAWHEERNNDEDWRGARGARSDCSSLDPPRAKGSDERGARPRFARRPEPRSTCRCTNDTSPRCREAIGACGNLLGHHRLYGRLVAICCPTNTPLGQQAGAMRAGECWRPTQHRPSDNVSAIGPEAGAEAGAVRQTCRVYVLAPARPRRGGCGARASYRYGRPACAPSSRTNKLDRAAAYLTDARPTPLPARARRTCARPNPSAMLRHPRTCSASRSDPAQDLSDPYHPIRDPTPGANAPSPPGDARVHPLIHRRWLTAGTAPVRRTPG
jgi:hypothetical protein